MAERGGQPGNKNAAKTRPWADAINRVLLAEDGKKLRALAEKLVDRAIEGDISALKEVGDRVDGKPAQQLDLANAGGQPLVLKFENADEAA